MLRGQCMSVNSENACPVRSKSRMAAAHQPPRLPRSSGGQRLGLNDITNIGPDRKHKDTCLDDKISICKGSALIGNERQQATKENEQDHVRCADQSSVLTRKPSKASFTPLASAATLAERHPLERDSSNVQNVSEYAVDIFDLLFITESSGIVRPNYMEEVHRDINGRMRAILIDWLVEVHMKYRLRNETLFLAINLLDRYLALEPVVRQRLQLVGVVSMFVAAKFEEIMPPEVHDFVYITDNAYTKAEILTLECRMLTVLSFQIAAPTIAHFMQFLEHLNGCDGPHRELAHYFTELALVEIRMIRYSPSHLAAAALLLSNRLLGRRTVWPLQMAQHSRYTEASLRDCSEDLRNLWENVHTSQLQAVKKKYMLPTHHNVARMTFGSS